MNPRYLLIVLAGICFAAQGQTPQPPSDPESSSSAKPSSLPPPVSITSSLRLSSGKLDRERFESATHGRFTLYLCRRPLAEGDLDEIENPYGFDLPIKEVKVDTVISRVIVHFQGRRDQDPGGWYEFPDSRLFRDFLWGPDAESLSLLEQGDLMIVHGTGGDAAGSFWFNWLIRPESLEVARHAAWSESHSDSVRTIDWQPLRPLPIPPEIERNPAED